MRGHLQKILGINVSASIRLYASESSKRECL